MTGWQVYWWLMLDRIETTLTVLAVFGSLGIILGGIFLTAWVIDERKKPIVGSFVGFCCLTCMLVLITAATLCPTSKQYAVVYLFPKVVNSEIDVKGRWR